MPKLLRDAQDVVHDVDRTVRRCAIVVVVANDFAAIVGWVVAGLIDWFDERRGVGRFLRQDRARARAEAARGR